MKTFAKDAATAIGAGSEVAAFINDPIGTVLTEVATSELKKQTKKRRFNGRRRSR